MRLNKYLSESGAWSRREADRLIEDRRVTINGVVVGLGTQVADGDEVKVDGDVIGQARKRAVPVYIALNKPTGITCTTERHVEGNIIDFVDHPERIFPIGRLDKESEGLILLTNDGAWAERVLHPRFGVEREYALGLRRPLDDAQLAALREGIRLDEGLATLTHLRLMTTVEVRKLEAVLLPVPPELTWYRSTLQQGWKRQLRRMYGAVGAPVDRLVRVRLGTLRLEDLPSGRCRRLTAPEVRSLGAGRTDRAR